MIALDASALIAQFESRDRHHLAAVALLEEHVAAELVSSTVSLSEMLVSYARAGRMAEGEGRLRRLGIVEVPLGPSAASRLADLRAATRLKLPDCCVLLAAQDAGAGTIATFDDRLADAARTLGLAVAGA